MWRRGKDPLPNLKSKQIDLDRIFQHQERLPLNRLLIELRIARKDPGVAFVFRRRLLANNREDPLSPTGLLLMQRASDPLVIDGDDVL